MEELRRVGGAVFSFIAPDILHMEWSGDLEAGAVESVGTLISELKVRHGASVVFLADVRHAKGMLPAARKKIIDVMRTNPFAAAAMVGASFKIRVLIELIDKAVRLVTPGAPPVQLFDSREQALAWFAELRASRGAL